jgi:hypothetical protein
LRGCALRRGVCQKLAAGRPTCKGCKGLSSSTAGRAMLALRPFHLIKRRLLLPRGGSFANASACGVGPPHALAVGVTAPSAGEAGGG